MYAPQLNPREAQDIARRSGNDRLVFWTSVVSLGFMGAMAASMTARTIFELMNRGHHGHSDEKESGPYRAHGRGR